MSTTTTTRINSCRSVPYYFSPKKFSHSTVRVFLKPPSFNFSLKCRSPAISFGSNSKNRFRFWCFTHRESASEIHGFEFSEEAAKSETEKLNDTSENWVSGVKRVADALFGVEPWTVPWTVKTIVRVMLLWITSFWLVGSWIIPFLAHTVGFRKETLTFRGQALYSLLTDVAEGLAGIGILHLCLARFRPFPSDWFEFSLKGKWHFDVGLGCLMFPLVNQLSQVNLILLPHLPSAPVAVSSVEQSIVARDPIAMALYAVVVSVCAPIWEEIVFRGFLLPSLTKYMPVWCSVIVSSIAFALAHFNMQRVLPLIFLGMVMGSVFTRSRNLLPSVLLHSLWNAFVFLDLMK
nr:uncharacterized protein LOC107414675 [Ziziphus jujuba var. spinosa]